MVKKTIMEFKEFLKEYNVLSLAVAFVMGLAINTLVKSFVDNIIMPFVNPLLQNGSWETATWAIGPFVIGWGPFLAAALNFLILALVVFIIAKKLFNWQKK
ncbi:MscL family protein [Candidatus Woesearchaeota archaeon]|nr:MscL family protein [Candidatus Woesearchaeota archaeon]